jgi:hypothetical protein
MTEDQFLRGALGAAIVASVPFIKEFLLSVRNRWRSRRAQQGTALSEHRSD